MIVVSMREAPSVDPTLVSETLQRILASREFSTAARMRRFLEHVVKQKMAGNLAELKESLIGVDVFDREPGYDPKYDAIVRVEARRLRAKLAEYYEGSGATDAICFVFPKGSYIPEFVPATAPPPVALPTPEPPRRPPLRRAHPATCPSSDGDWPRASPSPYSFSATEIQPPNPSACVRSPHCPVTNASPVSPPTASRSRSDGPAPTRQTTRIYVQKLGSDT